MPLVFWQDFKVSEKGSSIRTLRQNLDYGLSQTFKVDKMTCLTCFTLLLLAPHEEQNFWFAWCDSPHTCQTTLEMFLMWNYVMLLRAFSVCRVYEPCKSARKPCRTPQEPLPTTRVLSLVPGCGSSDTSAQYWSPSGLKIIVILISIDKILV